MTGFHIQDYYRLGIANWNILSIFHNKRMKLQGYQLQNPSVTLVVKKYCVLSYY